VRERESERVRKGEREKGRKGEREKGRKGEREKGRKGEREKGRKEEREKRRQGAFYKGKKAQAFNQDKCCHLALCLWLIFFNYWLDRLAFNQWPVLLKFCDRNLRS
jgi:hypothetical protein